MLKRIAINGERGSFAEDAVYEFFRDEIEILYGAGLAAVRNAIEQNQADFAVLPVRNSLVGTVETVKEFLQTVDWKKFDECDLQIRQNLIASRQASLETVQIVESHKVALAQCQHFLAGFPHWKKVESENTALSAKAAIESGNITFAAIANAKTAAIYGGQILCADIHDSHENYTTFYLFSVSKRTELFNVNRR